MGTVRLERDGHVATIVIDRPERRNAVDPETSQAMSAAVSELDADPEVWVILLTGAGDVFCAGADLAAIAAGRLHEITDDVPGGFGGLVRSERRTPVIAAVNGHALAGGFELMLACDLVVAAEDAQFGLPEVARGIIAGAGGLVRLPHLIAPKRALELILTADRISAAEAHALGLVNRVVPRDDVLPEAHALAARITANAPVAVRESRWVADQALRHGEEEGWAANERAWAVVLASEDAAEGPRAFTEKRPPAWTGR
jgi:enoyl-CoA hydratase/carnithine racemase